MKKENGLIHKIGLFLVAAGIVLEVLQAASNYGRIVTCAGVLLSVLTNPYKRVFVCSECGTKFENEEQVTIALGGRMLVTCPKCKKTNFCKIRYAKNIE